MGSLPLKGFRLTRRGKGVDWAFGGEGGLHTSGRWHTKGSLIVYCSESAALAYLEMLAHFGSDSEMIELQLFTIDIPDSAIANLTELPADWDCRPASLTTQKIGADWLRGKTSCCLKVPSVVVPMNWNILINPAHPAFSLAWVKSVELFPHDPRLVKPISPSKK